jgi:CheY-like chemotaxis protein
MGGTARARIALVNDDTTFLELMRDLLEAEEGHEVLICKESGNAHRFVKEQRPDMVLLDIRMGGEERGWTILELLTLDPETSSIPVVVCSAALSNLRDHEPLLQKYGVGVLPKPFDLDALVAKVRAALAKD